MPFGDSRPRSEVDPRCLAGYTIGMKTAISLPDELFDHAEQIARRMKKSRSQLYAAALAEYVARHAPELVTQGWNDVCADVDEDAEPFVAAASRWVLERTEW